jgi:hypothetical protein
MKLFYDIDKIISALDYYDIKGLLKCLDGKYFLKGEPSLTQMTEDLKEKLNSASPELKREVESLMISCARVNSIGY